MNDDMREIENFLIDKKHVLLFADDKGISFIQPLTDQIKEKNLSFELVYSPFEPSEKKLTGWLSNQQIGTALFIFAASNIAQKVYQLARQAGYFNEDIYLQKIGNGHKRVFCSKCHFINEVKNEEPFHCQNCQLRIKPSNHYSSYHHAYLGYPVLSRTEECNGTFKQS
jgi:dimethylamine monooxygenase subunit C